MKLSIILSVKEIDEYLINSVDSIINQNCNDFEVILVDEGYTNNSSKILEKYKNINNIEVCNYNFSNKTLGSSLNFGLSKAKGEYVMFVLGNDYFEDGFLKSVYENLGSYDLFKYDFTLLNSEKTYEETNEIISSNGFEAFKELIKVKDNFGLLNKYIIKKSLLIDNKIVLNKSDFYSNLTIIPYLLMLSNNFYNSELTGYVYRLQNNEFRRADLNTPKKLAMDVLTKYEYLESLNFMSAYNEEEKQVFLNYISSCVINELKSLKGKDKSEFRKLIKSKKIKKKRKGFLRG